MMKVASLTLALLLLTGILFSGLPNTIYASTDEGGSNEGGGTDDGSEPEPEPEPEVEPELEPEVEPEPEPEPQPEPQPGDANTCQGGPPGIDGCPPATEEPITSPEPTLPICDGSAKKCITNDGIVCDIGQGGHQCECAEDMSDCPMHPSLLVPDNDCLFHPELPKCASDNGVCPDGFFQNEDANCVPEHPNGCPEGFHSHEDDETGRCIPDSVPCEPGYTRDPDFPTCSSIESVCRDHPDEDVCKPEPPCPPGFDLRDDDVCHKDITIIINKVIKEIHSGKHHDAFPEIDIIGLSTKQDGDSMVCLMDIDSDDIQCQDFGMPADRVAGSFWRVIETDSSKNYDNGNTGSSDVDNAISAIKSHDFNELDDLDNHNFGVDLAWIAINPEGDGFVCLTEDQTGKGPSLCEPFKVSSADISGQVTEGVEFS